MKFLWVTHAQIPMPIKIRATFQNKLRPTEHHQWACHGLDSPEHRRRWQGRAGQPACGWQRPAAGSCPPRSLRWSSGIKACPVPCCLGAGSCSRSWWLAAGKTPVNNVRIMKILTCLSFQKKMLWTCPRLFPSTILKVTSFFSGMPGVLLSDILAPLTWETKGFRHRSIISKYYPPILPTIFAILSSSSYTTIFSVMWAWWDPRSRLINLL